MILIRELWFKQSQTQRKTSGGERPSVVSRWNPIRGGGGTLVQGEAWEVTWRAVLACMRASTCGWLRRASVSSHTGLYRKTEAAWKEFHDRCQFYVGHEDRRQRCKKWGLREIKLKTGKQHHRGGGGGGGRVRTTCGTTHRHSCKHPALLKEDVPGVNPDWERRNLGWHSLIDSSQKYAESTEKMCAHFRGKKKVDNYCNNRTKYEPLS